jgi:hypothetical protein
MWEQMWEQKRCPSSQPWKRETPNRIGMRQGRAGKARAIPLAFFNTPGEGSRVVNLAKRFNLHPATVSYYLHNRHPDE